MQYKVCKANKLMPPPPAPLVVDLDGTLINTDSLWDGFFQLMRSQPYLIVVVLRLIFSRNLAELKKYLAPYSLQTLETWHFNTVVMDYIISVRSEKRPVYLATAADRTIAEAIAAKLQCFDGVFASENGINLRGEEKAKKLVRVFGERCFDYIGDDVSDIAVWERCREALVVERSKHIAHALRNCNQQYTVLHDLQPALRDYLRVLRCRHWVKNFLVFIPIVLAHVLSGATLLAGSAAFVSFCACASGVYILNDLLDLPADRRHPIKSKRPFADGTIPLQQAPVLMICSLLFIMMPIFLLPWVFTVTLTVYFILNLFYSFALKRILFVDILLLAIFYILRIIAGGLAIGSLPSNWLLSFCLFIFVSLALIKRSTELIINEGNSKNGVSRRAYLIKDRAMLEMMAVGSGIASVVVLNLYIDSLRAADMYTTPQFLWLLCPILLYWIGRIFLLAHRGQMHDDPVDFTITDKTSILCVALGIIVIYIAI
jgi:4-hydroxybenzoate polyprenyltransferase